MTAVLGAFSGVLIFGVVALVVGFKAAKAAHGSDGAPKVDARWATTTMTQSSTPSQPLNTR